MSCEDLLIDRWLLDGELVAALAEVFSIALDDIMIVDSIAELNHVVQVKLICERAAVKGDFEMRLSLYCRDPRLNALENLPLIERFCQKLQCTCLVSDESQNPYSMLLVKGEGDTQIVYLDPERLDEQEEYVIKRTALDKSD